MTPSTEPQPDDHHQRLVEKLIDRMPRQIQTPTRWLRQPSSRWVRIPAGALLVGGGFLSILPLFGLWMLPLGLFLLAEDMSSLRRSRNRILDRLQIHRPDWFAAREITNGSVITAPAQSSAPSGIHS